MAASRQSYRALGAGGVALVLLSMAAVPWDFSSARTDLACANPRILPTDPSTFCSLTCLPGNAPLNGAAALLLGHRLDVNSASAQELSAIPGMSLRQAQAIVAERVVEPFSDLMALQRVAGIGAKTCHKWQGYLRF